MFKKVVSQFYYLNLLFRNNWFFFFRVEDFFFRDLQLLENIFSFDFSSFFFNFKNFSFFSNTLNNFSVFLKNVKLKKKGEKE